MDREINCNRTAECLAGHSADTKEEELVIDPKLLAMLGEESNIRIYPNPSSKQITIEYVLNEGEKGELLVYDIYGRERMKIDLSNTISRVSADISHLELGIYLYRYMINGKNSTTGKLIKE